MKIKINLLPEYYEEELKNLRLVGILGKFGMITMVSLFVFIMFMEACMQFIHIQQEVIQDETKKFESSEIYKQVKTANDKLTDYDKKAKMAKKVLNKQDNLWEYIEEFNKLLPEKVYLRELNINKEEMSVSGTAQEREALLTLQDNLEKSEKFKEMESPISNFVSETNAKFEISVKLKNEKR